MSKESFKNFWKKFWHLLWKDDSWKGWLFSIIFLFVFIKFIFFPGLSWVTGTQLPLAIVESCSMYHQGGTWPLTSYDSWINSHQTKYKNLNITEQQFSNFKMKNGFNKGDILFITGVKPENIKVGDIIIFIAPTTNPVIHRVIAIRTDPTTNKRIFSTEGDNNNGQLSFENNIQENQILGKAQFKLAPYLGWVKLVFFEAQKSPQERGFCTQR
ncbi:Uncharacterised protein [uncultured archaeon]|nr:Uncharacterised protein [uncultured archaeon]